MNLAFVSTADYSPLPALVQRFRLALTEATSDVQITGLPGSEIHAGILIRPAHAALPVKLAYRRLMSEPLIAAVPEQWIASGRLTLTRGQLSPDTVVTSPLIVFPRQVAPSFHDLVTNYYPECGGQANIAQHAIQMQTIISLVSAGMGIALVPESLRHLARIGIRYVPLACRPPQLDTGVDWRRDDPRATLANLLQVLDRADNTSD